MEKRLNKGKDIISFMMKGRTLKAIGTLAVLGAVGMVAAQTPMTLDAVKKKIETQPSVWKIVVGADAKASDVIGAVDIATALQYFSKVEEKQTVDLSNVKIVLEKEQPVVEGAIKLYKDTAKLYLGDRLDSVIPLINYQSGEVKGDSDTTYTYTVYIEPTQAPIEYKDLPDTDAKDPTVIVWSGKTYGLVDVDIKFTPALNLTDVRGKEIEILGKKFYLDTDDQGNLILRDAALDASLSVGQSVNFDGKTIKLVDIVSQEGKWYVVVNVNGEQKTIRVGDSDTVGGIEVYVKSAYKSELRQGVGYAELLIGGKKYVLEDGRGVLVNGENEDQRTLVTISKDNNGLIKEVKITFYKSDKAESDYLKAGEEYTLPLFDTYKIKFAPVSLTKGKLKISITPAGATEYSLQVTDFRGYTKTIPIKYSTDSGKVVLFEYDSNGNPKFVGTITGEGSNNLTLAEGQYFAVYNPDTEESYVYRVVRTYTENNVDKAELEDVFSGQKITLVEGDNVVLGGYTVTVANIDPNNAQLTLSGISYDPNTLYIEGKDETVLKLTQGANATVCVKKEFSEIAPQYTEKVEFTIYYNSDPTVEKLDIAGLDAMYVKNPVVESFNITGIQGTGTNYNVTAGELYVSTSTSVSGWVNVTNGTVEERVNVSASYPLNSGEFTAQSAGDYIDTYLTRAGIYVRDENTNDQDRVYIYVPKDAEWMNIELVPSNATVKMIKEEVKVGDAIDETGYKVVDLQGVPKEVTKVMLQPLVGVAVLDTEVQPTDNYLISVGGPAINRITAEFLGLEYPTYGAVLKEKGILAPGEAVIRVAEMGGRVAVLVFGWEAQDTRRAAREFAMYLLHDKDAAAFENATVVKVSGTMEAPSAQKVQ